MYWLLGALLVFAGDAALQTSDIVARLTFRNGSHIDASELVKLALVGPAPKKFAPAYALNREGNFFYRPKDTDGGDTACQGAVNMDQLGLLATPDVIPTLRNWLVLAVIRQEDLPNAGQMWSQPGGPYHGFGQGAMEANAEFILMAALYAAYTGDHKLFSNAPDRLVCAKGRGGTWKHTGAGSSWNSTLCSTKVPLLLSKQPQLYSDIASPPHKTIPRGKSTPGLYPGQGKVVITRVTLSEDATALSIALSGSASTSAAFTACVRSLKADHVVATVAVANGGLPTTGWLEIHANGTSGTFPAGVYDIAIRTASTADPEESLDLHSIDLHSIAAAHTPVGWVSDSAPTSSSGVRVSGGARTEVGLVCLVTSVLQFPSNVAQAV
jgi:hypothetical protein